MATFRTYILLDIRDMKSKKNIYIAIICCVILLSPIIYIVYIVPTIVNKIVVLGFYALFILSLYLIGKFYNYKYNGGAEVSVTKELVEIKLQNNQRKIFTMNSIKKIMLHNNSSKEVYVGGEGAPLLLTFTIFTSSPLGKVNLRFTDKDGRKFISEILKYKKPKRKGKDLLRRLIHDNLEEYYF